jgi:hypothetical protein
VATPVVAAVVSDLRWHLHCFTNDFTLFTILFYFGQNVYFWIDNIFISIDNSSLIGNFYFQVVTTTGMACDVATTWGVGSTTGSFFVGAASLWKTPCKCHEFELQVFFPDQ